MAADFFLGESLVGDGNEVAHVDLIIGSKSGPAGTAFWGTAAGYFVPHVWCYARGARRVRSGGGASDPDAPIAEFADLVVVGDLFEVGKALLEALRARA